MILNQSNSLKANELFKKSIKYIRLKKTTYQNDARVCFQAIPYPTNIDFLQACFVAGMLSLCSCSTMVTSLRGRWQTTGLKRRYASFVFVLKEIELIVIFRFKRKNKG